MKKIVKALSWLLTVVIIAGTVVQPLPVSAKTVQTATEAAPVEASDAFEINPLYADVLDAEAEKEKIQSIIDVGSQIALFSATDMCEDLEAAAALARGYMVNRVESFKITIPRSYYDLYADDGDNNTSIAKVIRAEAGKHTEDCTGQEGDALKWGWNGFAANYTIYSEYVEVNYSMTYHTTADQEEALTAKLETAYDELALDGLTDYEKAKKIYNYICDNVDYDNDLKKFSAYNALCEGKAVCQGYAILLYRMYKDNNLPVRLISGIGNGGAHGWNIVKIGDIYYNLDSTWDGQGTTTNSNYFLKNEADFVNHTRDAEYATVEFNAQYPMSEDSWVDYSVYGEGANVENLDYDFTTIEEGTVSSTANGKPKLLIFFSSSHTSNLNTIKAVSSGDFADVDIIAVEMTKADKDAVTAVKNTYGGDYITFTYDTVGYHNNYAFNYVWLLNSEATSVSVPVLVYIDEQNKVQLITQGSSSAGTIRSNIDYYCKALDVSLAYTSLNLQAGDTQDISAYINGKEKDGTRFNWFSSDSNVATVNQYGEVTAVADGSCVITCKLNDYKFAELEVTVGNTVVVPTYTVAVTSKAVGGSSSLAPVTGGGVISAGDAVTVTATAKDGYSFLGWYAKDESAAGYGGECLCETLSYTFTVTEDASLVAVYEANGTATVTVAGSGYQVTYNNNTSDIQESDYNAEIALGTKVTLDASANTNFLYWMNESGKIVSKNAAYTFTVTSDATITMACKGETAGTAFVEFVSEYGQVLAADTYGAEDTITFPGAPSKMGFNFTNWNMTEDAIKALIGTALHIIVNPLYEEEENVATYDVIVKQAYAGDTFGEAVAYTEQVIGTVLKLEAAEVEGKKFKCWATDVNGENVLGTDATYYTKVTNAATIYCVYVDENVVVEKEPVIAMTGMFARTEGNVHKITFTATRNVPEGYTLLEHGMLYSKTNDIYTEETLIVGGNSSKYVASNMAANGMLTMNVKVTEDNLTVYARGYMVVRNNATGNDEIYYTDVVSGSYSELQ